MRQRRALRIQGLGLPGPEPMETSPCTFRNSPQTAGPQTGREGQSSWEEPGHRSGHQGHQDLLPHSTATPPRVQRDLLGPASPAATTWGSRATRLRSHTASRLSASCPGAGGCRWPDTHSHPTSPGSVSQRPQGGRNKTGDLASDDQRHPF